MIKYVFFDWGYTLINSFTDVDDEIETIVSKYGKKWKDIFKFWRNYHFLHSLGRIKTKEEKYEQVRGWLLQAVILAEKEYGSGTGKMKLSSVYDSFCHALPWIAKTLTFEAFSEYVDDALEEAKDILSKNEAIASLASTMIKNEHVE